MIQTALGINGYHCTFCDGNTAEEYEAIAVALLRTAEAIRNGEEGRVGMPRTGWQSAPFGADPSLWSGVR
jgi:hypothetical protein